MRPGSKYRKKRSGTRKALAAQEAHRPTPRRLKPSPVQLLLLTEPAAGDPVAPEPCSRHRAGLVGLLLALIIAGMAFPERTASAVELLLAFALAAVLLRGGQGGK